MMSDAMKVIVGGIVVLVLLWMLNRLCSPEAFAPMEPNVALTGTAARAMESARDAHEDAAAFKSSVDRWYFIALVGTVALPLVLASLLLRQWGNAPPEPAEVFHEIEKMQMTEHRELPAPEIGALPEHKEPAQLPARPSQEDGVATSDNDE